MKFSNEARVGILVSITVIIGALFAWFIGVSNPFSSKITFYVTYHFAGGIEVGSPVRVSGIKVGTVEKIEFFVPTDAKEKIATQEPGSAESADEDAITPVKLKVSVSKDAIRGIRQDSRFYINLAGLIGERYLEVTPGTLRNPEVHSGQVFAGVDPPRIDQLLSQSFDLAGKIADLVERNKGDITHSIELLYKLSGNLNTTLKWIEKSGVFKNDLSELIQNLIFITRDLKKLSAKANSPELDQALAIIFKLLQRVEPLDSKEIRKFLQEEGVKAKVKFF